MTERTVPPNPYQSDSEPRMVQSPDAYLLQMNRQLGENTGHLKTLMLAFDSHVKKEEKHLEDDGAFKKEILAGLKDLKEHSFDSTEDKEWLKHQIQKDKDRHAIYMEVMKKIVSGSIWAGAVGLFTLIGYGLIHLAEKLNG